MACQLSWFCCGDSGESGRVSLARRMARVSRLHSSAPRNAQTAKNPEVAKNTRKVSIIQISTDWQEKKKFFNCFQPCELRLPLPPIFLPPRRSKTSALTKFCCCTNQPQLAGVKLFAAFFTGTYTILLDVFDSCPAGDWATLCNC